MLCPYCGDKRTEVLETVFRGHSTYRHRRCLYCKSRFSTREKQVQPSTRSVYAAIASNSNNCPASGEALPTRAV